jgi:hypothetical protein
MRGGGIIDDAVSGVASNGRMIDERWTGRYLEGRSRGLLDALAHFPTEKLEKQDDRWLRRDSSRTSPEYKSRALSVSLCWRDSSSKLLNAFSWGGGGGGYVEYS